MITNLPNQLPQSVQQASSAGNQQPPVPIPVTSPPPPPQNLLPSLPQPVPIGQGSTSAPVIPRPGPLPVPAQPTNIEQNALAGNNKQQISNFMTALKNVGAGGNNSFMNTSTTAAPVQQQLINPNVAYQNNGTMAAPQQSQAPSIQATQSNPQSSTNFPIGGPMIPFNNNTGQSNPTPAGGVQIPVLNNTYQPAANSPVVAGTQVPVQNNTYQGNTTPAAGTSSNIQLPPQQFLVSDENLKTNISPAQSKLTDFMNKINAHSYTYKEPEKDGVGTFTSPMAQELEATELGKQAVIDTPRGKMVDYARLGGVNLAAVATVHREQQRLQDQINQMRKEFKLSSPKKSAQAKDK